ncbi:MAG: DEAD/DEAH box helicase family protein [Turneriella sp.]|nr:DEAD/DEAH box helicase family protein [Turneriella sp.]
MQQGKLNFDAAAERPVSGRLLRHTLTADDGSFEVSLRLPEAVSATTDATLTVARCEMTTLYARLWNLMERYYREPLAVFSSSRTMLLPHQVEAALKVVSASRPRFLIADEVGLGKTIEAGLILKELKLKHGYNKILIVVPSPLMAQWQQELKTKFAEDFTILTGDVLRRGKAFSEGKQFLVSIDLAKDERYLELFLAQNFDLVVFDEAHRLRRDANTVTQAWHFAHAMGQSVEGLLLLSATPFRGKLEEIFFLIQLLDPDILGPLATFQTQFAEDASLLRDRLSPVVIRRRKIDVGGFTKRFAKTVKIDLTRDERTFYDRTTEYVKTEFNRALSRGENLKTFIMIVFQKLLDSSPYALLKALEGRRARLEGLYFRVMHEMHESEDVAQAVREFQEEEGFEDSEILNPQEIRAEIQTLTHLAQLGKKISIDSKLTHLKKTLKTMQSMGHKKFVIFTQFKSTLEYLTQNLTGYKIAGFHGGLNFEQKEQAIRDFFADVEILICTEAGGEGRNLQIAACLINYDLPWSPLKLEQRIGRIHRFGQTRDVHIVNFACRDTVAERVVEVLEEKIRLFENALGPSDTLLGVFESEYKFGRSLMAFLGAKKTKREHNEELERSLFLAKENLVNVDKLITTEHMNFNLAAFKEAQGKGADQSRMSGLELKSVMLDYAALKNIGCKESGAAVEFAADTMPARRGTFDHEAATDRVDLEFFAFGHELIDRFAADIIAGAEKNPIVKIDAGRSGMVFFFSLVLELDKKYKRMYRVWLPRFDEAGQVADPEIPDRVAMPMVPDATWLKAVAVKAIDKIAPKIAEDIRAIMTKIRPSESYWHYRIVDSAAARKTNIEEKLEIQRGKLKWYGGKFAGSVSKLAGDKRRSEIAEYERLRRSDSRLNPKIVIDLKKVCVLSNDN